jgi:sucrose-phosphate synthase
MVIHVYSLHGLFKLNGLEIGRDADNGGQIQYVWDLIYNLQKNPRVTKVVLITRLINDPDLVSQYSQPLEKFNQKLEIVRIACGGDKYLMKEELWQHWDEFIQNLKSYYINNPNQKPNFIYSHYADAGYVASKISEHFAIPYLHHAHALGRMKRERLLEDKIMDAQEVDKKFNFPKRIGAEERTLQTADFVVVSTEFEKRFYQHYDNNSAEFIELPPGVDETRFRYYLDIFDRSEENKLIKKITAKLSSPDLPAVVVVARPTIIKNIVRIVQAYVQNSELQKISNLIIFAGNWKTASLNHESQKVIEEIQTIINKNNLEDKIYFPPSHLKADVPVLYRWAARNKGVFAMVSITEPFGLTTLEASMSGLPVVATTHGGPAELVTKCKNGLVVDPFDVSEIGQAFYEIISNKQNWNILSQNGVSGVKKYYTWKSHVNKLIDSLKAKNKALKSTHFSLQSLSERLNKDEQPKLLVCDIDNTLTGDDVSLKKFKEMIDSKDRKFVFALASGRSKEMIIASIIDGSLPTPDIIICSVGAKIFYGDNFEVEDTGYSQYLRQNWEAESLKQIIESTPEAKWQKEEELLDIKLSLYLDSKEISNTISQKIKNMNLQAQLIYSLGLKKEHNLDILPIRASKYKAIIHLSHKLGFFSENIYVAGDSGNDFDMLNGDFNSIVVANHTKDLEPLKKVKGIYFSRHKYASGVLDGLKHYKLI